MELKVSYCVLTFSYVILCIYMAHRATKNPGKYTTDEQSTW